jgi:ribosomal protein S18 acetylase RimI-like enzyme
MGTERQFTVRPLLTSDLGAVARIHCDAFGSSGFTCFGENVVRRYYEWQMSCLPKLVGYVAAEAHHVVGYAFCGDTFLSPAPFLAKHPDIVFAAVLHRPSRLFDVRIIRMAAYAVRALLKKFSVANTSTQSAGEPASTASFWVEAVAVERASQGCGIGALLTRKCAECGFAQGFTELYLAVETTNLRAIAMYEKLGWRSVRLKGQWRGRMKLTARTETAIETAC